MKGKIRIIVSTKRLRYDLTLRRNITIIQGNSASGKTTLIQIIADYQSGKAGPGTEVQCDRKCIVLSGDSDNAITLLKSLSNTIIFVDEQDKFLYSKAFAEAVLNSGCYFVFIVRDALNMLPYSVNEIYYFKNSGYYQNTKQIYNSMHQVYPEMNQSEKIAPSIILTEDSNAGHEMYKAICKDKNTACDTANGKSNIAKYILNNSEKNIFAIVDGAAFGADMQSTMHALKTSPGSYLWTPESFEYLILHSNIIHAEGLNEILKEPENFIESSMYCSWERFFTRLLEDLTKNTIYSYNKGKLNPNYLTKGNITKIKKLLPKITL